MKLRRPSNSLDKHYIKMLPGVPTPAWLLREEPQVAGLGTSAHAGRKEEMALASLPTFFWQRQRLHGLLLFRRP